MSLPVRSGLREGQRITYAQAAAHVTVTYAAPARWPWVAFCAFWAAVSKWVLG